jgi:uncharacterized protein (DUF1778 family)
MPKPRVRLKQDKEYKTEFIGFRLTKEHRNEIQLKANIYAEGNISEFVLYAARNFLPQYEDLEAPELDELIKESAKAKHTNFTKR